MWTCHNVELSSIQLLSKYNKGLQKQFFFLLGTSVILEKKNTIFGEGYLE